MPTHDAPTTDETDSVGLADTELTQPALYAAVLRAVTDYGSACAAEPDGWLYDDSQRQVAYQEVVRHLSALRRAYEQERWRYRL
jgi:hypothetical protein